MSLKEVIVNQSKCGEGHEKDEVKQGLLTNRIAEIKQDIKLIQVITDLIESSDITLIEDRDDAATLAIHIVNGLEDEADRRRLRDLAQSPSVPIKCPECEAVQEGSEFLGLANHSQITCRACDHVAPVGEFRKETPGYGGGSE